MSSDVDAMDRGKGEIKSTNLSEIPDSLKALSSFLIYLGLYR